MIKNILVLLYYTSRTWFRKYDLTYTGLRLWYLVTISLKSSFSDNVIASEPITQERVNFNFQIIFRFVSICSNLHDCCPFRRIGFTYSWNLLISSLENTWFWESWCAIFTRVVYTSEEIELWDTNRELCGWWPSLTDLPWVSNEEISQENYSCSKVYFDIILSLMNISYLRVVEHQTSH